MSYKKGNTGYSRNESIQEREFDLIKLPLHQYYQNKAELFLENGKAYKIAGKFKRISSSQLRKILNQSKVCMTMINNVEPNVNEAKNLLYALLPLAAYNSGRDSSLKVLYDFLSAHINKNTLVSEKDIECFDELFTSIVAYHKYFGGK